MLTTSGNPGFFVGVREEITGWDHRGDRTLVCYLVAHEAAFAVPYYVDNHKMLKPSENPGFLLVYVRKSHFGILGGAAPSCAT